MKRMIRKIVALLESGETVALATIAESSGSTPRSSGAKMALRNNGTIEGTVGGGPVEACACKRGAELLSMKAETALFTTINLRSDLAAVTDMICGGDLTLFIETIAPESDGSACYQQLDLLLRRGKRAVMATAFRCAAGEGESVRVVGRVVAEQAEALQDMFDLGKEQATELFDRALQKGGVMYRRESLHVFIEGFVPPPSLYLFGAGHVSCATARIAATVGFRVVVIDDRAEFANMQRFPNADEILVVDSFEAAFAGQAIGADGYIVIFTRGHVHDKTVLKYALKTPAFYVGMIGSRHKRDVIYSDLLASGTSQEDIKRCHSPIGISIGAQTPEEIALSIVSELIAVRAGVRDKMH